MNEEVERKCNSCSQTKAIQNFHKNGSRGRHRICSLCRNNKRKNWDDSWKSNPDRLYRECKRSAAKRNIEFKLTKKEFFSFKDSICHYCGDKLYRISLDRVDNVLGYFKSNLVPCCTSCNFLKHKNDKEKFLEHVSKIYLYQKGKE